MGLGVVAEIMWPIPQRLEVRSLSQMVDLVMPQGLHQEALRGYRPRFNQQLKYNWVPHGWGENNRCLVGGARICAGEFEMETRF